MTPPLTEAALLNPQWKKCQPGNPDFDAWRAEGYDLQDCYRLCQSERRAILHQVAYEIRITRKLQRKLDRAKNPRRGR